MNLRAILVGVLGIMLLGPTSHLQATEQNDPRIEKAKDMFQQYVHLEQVFDVTVADLYADEALIRNKRTYPSGQVRVLTLPAPKYKELIRAAMPIAKQRGDTNKYSKVAYAVAGEGVQITADRFSDLKQYHSPLLLLVKPAESGRWLIFEELSESQP